MLNNKKKMTNISKINIVNEEIISLKDVLLTYTSIHQNTALLDFGHVLIQRGYQNLTKVRLLSGGVAKKDLIHANLIGKGMLTAAVFGEELTPNSRLILHTIKELSQGENCGVIVLAQAGLDLFNFALAVQRANEDCRMRVELLQIKDYQGIPRGQYSCGFILLTKVLGAMAEKGELFYNICKMHQNIVDLIVTIPLSYVVRESDYRTRVDMGSLMQIQKMFDDENQSKLNLHHAIPIVVLINTASSLEMTVEYAVVKQVIEKLSQIGICILRFYVGHFVPIDSESAFLTVMKIYDTQVIDYLDAPCEAYGWRQIIQHQKITKPSEVSGVLRKQGKESIDLEGPKLLDTQTKYLKNCLSFACEAIKFCERQLNTIDAELDVGNIGTRLRNLADEINGRIEKEKLPLDCPYAVLKKIGILAESILGGTMGSIYGIMFENAAKVFRELPDDSAVTSATWVKVLENVVTGLKQYSRAEKEPQNILAPLEACQEILSKQMEDNIDHLYIWAMAVSSGVAAAAVRLPHCKFADPGVHAVSIWMRAVYEALKESKET